MSLLLQSLAEALRLGPAGNKPTTRGMDHMEDEMSMAQLLVYAASAAALPVDWTPIYTPSPYDKYPLRPYHELYQR
jgi:hypothetical protein